MGRLSLRLALPKGGQVEADAQCIEWQADQRPAALCHAPEGVLMRQNA